MPAYLLLLTPSANRVYQATAPRLASAELSVTTAGRVHPHVCALAGVDYLGFDAEPGLVPQLAQQSCAMALFERVGELLRPVELPTAEVMDSDLVTIPKYQGKTNELFTRLVLHVTLSQVTTGRPRLSVLDPLAGRGTTLLTAWTLGHDAYGVELDEKAFDQFCGFLKGYLRRKRLKHSAAIAPVRREGRVISHRLDAEVRPSEATHGHRPVPDAPDLAMTFFTGDTADSAALFGRKMVDAVVTDAPYGVVHGSTPRRQQARQGRGTAAHPAERDRSPADLLARAVPVWASMLRPGGALGVGWNTYGLSRQDFASICTEAGLQVRGEGAWLDLVHRVDASIRRDVMVAVKPRRNPADRPS